MITICRDTEWQKLKENYQLGLKHGMKLAAISGVNGVYSDADIAKVVELAKKARKTWAPGEAVTASSPKKRPARKKAAAKKKAAARKKAAPKKKATAKKKAAATRVRSARKKAAAKPQRAKATARKTPAGAGASKKKKGVKKKTGTGG